MRFLFWLIPIACLELLTGCGLQITYHSDPPGAVLYQGQTSLGYTPVMLQYDITDEHKKLGYIQLEPPQVRWASGAQASISSLTVDLSKGLVQRFTFIRPETFPGRQVDLQFALELEKIKLMREQLEAQKAAYQQIFNAINQQNQPQQPSFQNCTSTNIGNTVYTRCH